MEHKYLMDICKEYVNSEKFPGYAIWLNGAWGCGKTFLCQKVKEDLDPVKSDKKCFVSKSFSGCVGYMAIIWNYIKAFFSKTAKKKCVGKNYSIWYISLFGVKSIAEIDDKLFEAAHPLVSEGKTGISMLYKISKVAVKHKFNIDIKDIGDAIPGLLKKEPRTCRALIVDDVERSNLKSNELFGYFSSLLDDGIRIVFVGNEDEYMGDDEKNKELYKKTKEKLIGHTYEVSADFENAVNAFIKEMDLSEEFKEPLRCIVKNLKTENLRIIKQCLYGWHNFYCNIDNSEIKEKKEYIGELFEAYIVFVSQYKSGALLKDYEQTGGKEAKKEKPMLEEKLQLAWVMYKKYNTGINDENVSMDKNKDLFMDKIFYKPYLLTAWQDIVINGRAADEKWLNDKIEEDFNKIYHVDKRSSLEQVNTLLSYPSQDKLVNIEKIFLQMIKEFKSGKYLKWEEIVSFVRIYTILLEEGILSMKYNQKFLADLLEQYIKMYGDQIELTFTGYEIDHSIKTFKNICNNFDGDIKVNLEKIIDIIEKKEEQRTQTMFSNKQEFFSYIEANDPLNGYNDIGIMSMVHMNELFSWLKEENAFDMDYKLLHFLETRYGKNISNLELQPKYFCDIDNVKKLYKKYQEKIDSLQNKFDLSKRQYGYLKKEYEELIKYMEAEIEKSNRQIE